MAEANKSCTPIRKILPLPQSVINKIAAGEVIQRPASVVKELIENSIDAGATQISVTYKYGGLKVIQIKDNGCGIGIDDLAIACRRFTTSKLRSFDELQTIETFGFRGEALASISHVSFLTITSRTNDSQCAYKVVYKDGEVSDPPITCAGNVGTTMLIQDLFFNLPIRKQALRGESEEAAKINSLLISYAIHNPHCAFILKRLQDSSNDQVELSTSANSSVLRNISLVFKQGLVKELIEFKFEDHTFGLNNVSVLCSNPNYSLKKLAFILFINDRLVDCSPMRRSIEQIYSNYLPRHTHPFVYLHLKIRPQNVDVNVHPAKSEVQILHQESIIARITELLESRLQACDRSRNYLMQTRFPKMANLNSDRRRENVENLPKNSNASFLPPKTYDHSLVRSNARERRLEQCWPSSSHDNQCNVNPEITPILTASSSSCHEENVGFQQQNIVMQTVTATTAKQNNCIIDKCVAATVAQQSVVSTEANFPNTSDDSRNMPLHQKNPTEIPEGLMPTAVDAAREWRNVRLTSVLELQRSVISAASSQLRQIITEHTLIGCIDAKYVLVQHQTGLYLLNIEHLSRHMFYQLLLFRFGNLGSMRLSVPTSLTDLIYVAINQLKKEAAEEFISDDHENSKEFVLFLMSKADMLWDYFSIELTDGCMHTLPMLLPGYMPQLEGMPLFVWELVHTVDWNSEKACFDSFCQATAKFFALKQSYCDNNSNNRSVARDYSLFSSDCDDRKSILENILLPAFKSRLLPPETCWKDRSIIKLCDLHDLYKVFERC